jgi:predicted cupin superfamily sugar epimerase
VTAKRLIQLLHLTAHPAEGGFFRETYRSSATFEPGAPFAGTRSHGTAIYYLLTWDTFSAMHCLPGDELFHFYLGDPVEMLMLRPTGEGEVVVLGQDLAAGMTLQHVVPGGTWQGSRLVAGGEWALLGTTMAPGFEFADYLTGSADLLDDYPAHGDMIRALLGAGS